LINAFESKDHDRIHESVRRMREIVTPTPRRRARGKQITFLVTTIELN